MIAIFSVAKTYLSILFRKILPSEKRGKRRLEATEYPKTGKVCSEHFTPDSFLQSSTFKEKYCATSSPLPPTRHYLKHNAVPSIFPHKETPRQRLNTVNRIKRREYEEVIFFVLTFYNQLVGLSNSMFTLCG